MTEEEPIQKRLDEPSEVDEARFMANFDQIVKNKRHKAWYGRHINKK